MKFRSRTSAIAGAATLSLAALGGVAVAQSTPAPAETTATQEQEPELNGTVPVDEAALPEGDEAAESQALADLASVTALQAESAALDAVPGGTVAGSELGDENGFAVWEVDVMAVDGTHKEVKVDAGDGSVLATEDDDDEGGQEEAEGSETGEANEPPETSEGPEDEANEGPEGSEANQAPPING